MDCPSFGNSNQARSGIPSPTRRSARGTVLIIDDDEDILERARLALAHEGYDVLAATTGEHAIELTRTRQPDLTIFDLTLPDIGGLEIRRYLKDNLRTRQIPVVILTAPGEDGDVITDLELGADDYLVKPFDVQFLVARVRRALRKKVAQDLTRSVVRIHDITIDPSRWEALISGNPITLTLSEFNILYLLAKRPGVVFTRYQIVDALHGSNYAVTERAVDVQIACLRKKLGTYRDYIETVRSVGYRFAGRRPHETTTWNTNRSIITQAEKPAKTGAA